MPFWRRKSAPAAGLLTRGERWTTVVPVPRDQIVGVVLGDRTNRAWIDDEQTELVLLDHDRVPPLMEFDTRRDDEVPKREFDLVVDGGLALKPREG